jgi:Kef-type K+ transport system membrane component KefB
VPGLDSLGVLAGLAWPAAFALAWVAGEVAHRTTGLPRISVYGLVGFALGQAPLQAWSPDAASASLHVANVAFGLVLFEFGYRINLRWLRANPWLGATGVLEAGITFVATYLTARGFGAANLSALLLASLAMSTSPAAVIRVINEQRSSGLVTERVLHLTAMSSVLAVLAFKTILGFWAFDTSGDLWLALSSSVLVLAVSSGIGAAFGVLAPGMLRRIGRLPQDATVGFAICVILLVALTHALKLSPLLAALTFGLVARHRRVILNRTQRNFGVLGDLLCVVLFTYVATTLDWTRVLGGLGLGLTLIAVRMATKVAAVSLLARPSGTTWRKGALTGVALMPISVFVILLLEQTRLPGFDLIDQIAALAALTLLLELFGPIATHWAIRQAGEACEEPERPARAFALHLPQWRSKPSRPPTR